MDTASNGAPNIIERAYQLAESGRCLTIEDVLKQLKAERFDDVDSHMAGSDTRAKLRQMCRMARSR